MVVNANMVYELFSKYGLDDGAPGLSAVQYLFEVHLESMLPGWKFDRISSSHNERIVTMTDPQWREYRVEGASSLEELPEAVRPVVESFAPVFQRWWEWWQSRPE